MFIEHQFAEIRSIDDCIRKELVIVGDAFNVSSIFQSVHSSLVLETPKQLLHSQLHQSYNSIV
ncbi:hypothetical protein Sjap_000394 [Stephania japonica]|uniref:Uncharacterized protein n=1 Tax=Stephania japonica TaxID=461633 RepID=A0AAP0KJS5_9MAGN